MQNVPITSVPNGLFAIVNPRGVCVTDSLNQTLRVHSERFSVHINTFSYF